jgi:hypothetical protein
MQLTIRWTTGNTLRDSLYGHVGDVKSRNYDKPVSRHFNLAAILTSNNSTFRDINKRLEEEWIRKLKSRSPQGLNLT